MHAANPDRPRSVDAPLHRDRNVISALLGIVGFFVVWGLALSAGGRSEAYINTYSMLIVVFSPLAVLTAIYGWAGVIDACAWVFRKSAPCKTADDAVTFFQLAAAFCLASGFLGTMVGLVAMLTRLENPRGIGPGMAAALLSQLYGVFLAVIFIAVAAYTARRHRGATATAPLARRAAGIAGITTVAGTLTALIAFGILMLSLAPNL